MAQNEVARVEFPWRHARYLHQVTSAIRAYQLKSAQEGLHFPSSDSSAIGSSEVQALSATHASVSPEESFADLLLLAISETVASPLLNEITCPIASGLHFGAREHPQISRNSRIAIVSLISMTS